MLLQFSVENFLSFDAMTTFSMRATDEADHPGHVLRRGKHQAVRGAALYGANAAGKSNLIKAMAYSRDLIISRKGTPLKEAIPFRLNNNADKPSGFHWQWLHVRRKWSYGFDIHERRIIEEYLFAEPEEGGVEELWFERKTDGKGESHIELGEQLLDDPESDDARLIQLLAPRTSTEELFLHRCRDNEIKIIDPVFNWFADVLLVVRAEADYETLILEATENKDFSEFLSEQMRDAGTGVTLVQPASQTLDSLIEHTKLQHREGTRDFLNAIVPSMSIGDTRVRGGDSISNASVLIHKDSSGQATVKSLASVHRSNSGDAQLFRWAEESEGTQRYLHLLPRLYRLQTRPTVLVIDELERRLHTLLSRRFVEQSLGIADLPESQLIFTTHDTNLLDNTLLRRDEIWFVDKNENGASSLFSLASFKDFDSPNYEQAYLMGLFEAIPYFRNSHQLSPALRKTDENTND